MHPLFPPQIWGVHLIVQKNAVTQRSSLELQFKCHLQLNTEAEKGVAKQRPVTERLPRKVREIKVRFFNSDLNQCLLH